MKRLSRLLLALIAIALAIGAVAAAFVDIPPPTEPLETPATLPGLSEDAS